VRALIERFTGGLPKLQAPDAAAPTPADGAVDAAKPN
jgi:hypothetical protein